MQQTAHYLPGSFLSPLKAGPETDVVMAQEIRLQRFIEATHKKRELGLQKNSLLDLRGITDPIVVIGDLHGEADNLRQIMLHGNLYERLAKGEIHLHFLGDLLHHVDAARAAQMDGSIQTLAMVMNLMIEFPERVHWNPGNHDVPSLTSKKSGIDQTEVFKKYFEETFGSDQFELLRKAIEQLPLVVVHDDFVATHGGPIKGINNPLEALENFIFKDSDFDDLPDIARSAICARPIHWNKDPAVDRYSFSGYDADVFLQSCGVSEGLLLLGHTPHKGGVNWNWSFDNVRILHACTRSFGYGVMQNGQLVLHEVGIHPFEMGAATINRPSTHGQQQESILTILEPLSEPLTLHPGEKVEFSDKVLPLEIYVPGFPEPYVLDWIASIYDPLIHANHKGYFLTPSPRPRKFSADSFMLIRSDSEQMVQISDLFTPQQYSEKQAASEGFVISLSGEHEKQGDMFIITPFSKAVVIKSL